MIYPYLCGFSLSSALHCCMMLSLILFLEWMKLKWISNHKISMHVHICILWTNYIRLATLSVTAKRKRERPYKIRYLLYINDQCGELCRFSHVRLFVRPSVYMTTSPSVFEISIWNFAPVLFTPRSWLFVETTDTGPLYDIAAT